MGGGEGEGKNLLSERNGIGREFICCGNWEEGVRRKKKKKKKKKERLWRGRSKTFRNQSQLRDPLFESSPTFSRIFLA